MKQRAPQILRPVGEKNQYRIAAWTAFLALLLTWGGLRAMRRMWGAELPPQFGMIAAAVVGVACCAAAQILQRRNRAAWWLAFVPWPVLLIALGPGQCWMGLRRWINTLLDRWNQIHDGGLALLSVGADAGMEAVTAFSVLAALFVGEAAWMIVMRRCMILGNVYCIFWIIMPLLTETFDPWACALLLSGLVGLHMSIGAPRLTRRGLVWTLGVAAVFSLCASCLPRGDMLSIDTARENAAQFIHDVRYGETVLPEGDLYRAWRLQRADGEMLTVRSEQQKTLYLRGYVGGAYENGKWNALPESAYGGDSTGMFDWLAAQGFDPLTQTAAYYQLTGGEQKPQTNDLTVGVADACREYAYAPATLQAVTSGRVQEKRDAGLFSRGLTGAREYTVQELSGSRPAELLVADSWVANPQNEQQQAYSEAEAVYRDFVYRNYTQVDAELEPLMQQLFWRDYESGSDGIYSALSRVRAVLKNEERYADAPAPAPEGADPIAWFLTESHEGNAVLYAAATVEALRAHGIPARYAEGYHVPSYALAESEDGSVSVTSENAHAWAEVYFDGVGWLPLDATPGFYYDAVTLQQMVGVPDTVRKTAAVEEKPLQAEDNGSDGGFDAAELEPTFTKAVDMALLLLGALALLIVIAAVLFSLAEIARGISIYCLRRRYRRASMEERVQMLESSIFALLTLWGVKASLGWNTDDVDRLLAWWIESVQSGDYKKVCALMEKSVYGGIPLEAYEERLLLSFIQQLDAAAGRIGNRRQWLRLRYLCLTLL